MACLIPRNLTLLCLLTVTCNMEHFSLFQIRFSRNALICVPVLEASDQRLLCNEVGSDCSLN
jgi:hypothetical protein